MRISLSLFALAAISISGCAADKHEEPAPAAAVPAFAAPSPSPATATVIGHTPYDPTKKMPFHSTVHLEPENLGGPGVLEIRPRFVVQDPDPMTPDTKDETVAFRVVVKDLARTTTLINETLADTVVDRRGVGNWVKDLYFVKPMLSGSYFVGVYDFWPGKPRKNADGSLAGPDHSRGGMEQTIVVK
jgi:hypothetical protein